MSKGNIEFKDGKIVAGIDANEDGQNSLTVKLSVTEAIQEGMAALKKGEKKEISVDVKAVNFVFDGGKISLEIDTDRDGEELLDFELDLGESFEEISGLVLKK